MQSQIEQPPTTLAFPVRPEACPVEEWLALLGHRWSALLLWQLRQAPRQHRELLERLPGITAKVLSERLKALSQRELIKRVQTGATSQAAVYQLTERGLMASSILDQFEHITPREEQRWPLP